MNTYFKKIITLIEPYKKFYMIGQAAMLITTITGLAFPIVIKNIFDTLINRNNARILLTSTIMLAVVFLVKEVSNYIKSYNLSLAGQKIVANLRLETYGKLQDIPLAYYNARKSGDIISVFTNDLKVFQDIISTGITYLLQSFVALTVVIIMLLKIDYVLTISISLILPLIIIISRVMGRKIKQISSIVQIKLGNITAIINETVLGMDVIKGFMLGKHALGIFKKENDIVQDKSVQAAKVKAVSTLLNGLLNSLYLLLITGLGAYRVSRGFLNPSDLIAFVLYTEMIYGPIVSLSDIYMEIQRSTASISRIFKIMDAAAKTNTTSPMPLNGKILEGGIKFDNVCFSYSTKSILHDINIDILPGETVALIGPSGVGKSTFMKLIPRFYEVCSGQILIGGINIKDLDENYLRGMIAAVPQETFLFGMSVRDNIACGKPDANDEEIFNAAKLANAHDFILNLENGYDTILGEKGASLSGGQRQRIAIARASIKNPKILLLDEATSSIDSESERKVLYALQKLMTGRTTIISAHKLSTIEKANKVVVLNNGRIEAVGTHQELLNLSELYNNLMIGCMKTKVLTI